MQRRSKLQANAVDEYFSARAAWYRTNTTARADNTCASDTSIDIHVESIQEVPDYRDAGTALPKTTIISLSIVYMSEMEYP